MESKRDLIKGFQPPRKANSLSYTEAPISKDEVTVRQKNEKDIPGKSRVLLSDLYLVVDISSAIEFSSRGCPQPFLDPSIMQRRIQAENQRKLEQERKRRLESEMISS
jgi:hypothetical protein